MLEWSLISGPVWQGLEDVDALELELHVVMSHHKDAWETNPDPVQD